MRCLTLEIIIFLYTLSILTYQIQFRLETHLTHLQVFRAGIEMNKGKGKQLHGEAMELVKWPRPGTKHVNIEVTE